MRYIFLFVAFLFSSSVYAGEMMQSWPLQGEDETDQRVQVAYAAQCEQWSKDNPDLLSGDQAADFLTNCAKDMVDIWPVGLDQSED